jgi:NTE family protein
MPNDAGKKTAVVLSGGGAYGAYEIGVLKALFAGKSPATGGAALDPDIFVGTSVGGFNAAVLAMNKGGATGAIAHLERIWRDHVADKGDGRGNGVYRIRGNPLDYFDPRLPATPMAQLERLFADTTMLGKAAVPRVLNFFSPAGRLLDRMEGLVDISAFLNIDPFCHLVESMVEPATLRKSGKVLRVMATAWVTGDAQDFDFPRMTDEATWAAIRASAAIPGLFPPVKLWNETFIDGGVVQNTPINPAVEQGATEIHVVSLNPNMAKLPDSHIENTLDTFNRVYTAMLASNVAEDVESARWINDGLEVLERIEAGEDLNSDTMSRFARVAGIIYRKLRAEGKLPSALTIHRYYPDKCLGDTFGMLNFHQSAIEGMIQDGYENAIAHDCQANDCVIAAAASFGKRAASAAGLSD